jgi:cytoskeletal protein RodZ
MIEPMSNPGRHVSVVSDHHIPPCRFALSKVHRYSHEEGWVSMSERGKLSTVVTRRRLVQIAGATGIASLLLVACSQSASSPPTPAPQLTSASAPTSQPTSAAQPAATAASTPQAASTAQPVATTAPAAVAAGATASGTPKRSGTLNVVVQNDFVTMWPVVTTGPYSSPLATSRLLERPLAPRRLPIEQTGRRSGKGLWSRRSETPGRC